MKPCKRNKHKISKQASKQTDRQSSLPPPLELEETIRPFRELTLASFQEKYPDGLLTQCPLCQSGFFSKEMELVHYQAYFEEGSSSAFSLKTKIPVEHRTQRQRNLAKIIPVSFFTLVVLYSDDYFALKEPRDPTKKRKGLQETPAVAKMKSFLRIMKLLPLFFQKEIIKKISCPIDDDVPFHPQLVEAGFLYWIRS